MTLIDPVGLDDGAIVSIRRGRDVIEQITLGRNEVSVVVIHPDGSFEDHGISFNLLTNDGRDLIAAGLGSPGFGVSATIATASSATSLTATATPFVASAYKGWTVVAEESTNAPVWANIGANTTSVLTVDAWKNGDDSAGNTPGSTANYFILPSVRARYMGLTTDSGAASASDSTLASEQTGNGVNRQLATYAHTGATATFTMAKTFAVTGTVTAIHKMGLFTASNTTAGGIMVFETVLNQDATVGNGDSLAVTWTGTISG